MLGRASSPPGLLAAGSREIGGPLGGGVATPGPKQDGGAFSKSLPPTPTVLGGPEPPHPGSPRPLGLSAGALRDADGSWDHEGEGRRPQPPLAPMPCSPGPPHSRCSATMHASCPVRPSHRHSSGSKWFPPWPHPPQSGVGGQGGTWPPHRCPLLRSHMSPSRCVSPPLLCLSSRPPRSLSPCPPCSLFTRVRLTFLGLSPSLPVSFLPSAPHRDPPGPGRAPCLCAPVSLSLSVL